MLFRNTIIFALASTALAVDAQMLRSSSSMIGQEEPQLPEPAANDPNVLYMQKKDAYMKSKVAGTAAAQAEGKKDGGKGSFGMQKGVKCSGGFEAKKGMKKHCEGGMEKDFSMSFTTSEMKNELGSELMKQLNDFMPEPEMLVGVSDEEMEAHLLGDEDGVGVSKTLEFGGIVKGEWGCKVTFEKSVKGISKKVKCGAKFDAGSGKKEMAEGASVLDQFNKAAGSVKAL